MGAPATLFDLDPFTERTVRSGESGRAHSMRPDVWAALQHLKAVMDSMPPEELARRKRIYETTQGRAR